MWYDSVYFGGRVNTAYQMLFKAHMSNSMKSPRHGNFIFMRPKVFPFHNPFPFDFIQDNFNSKWKLKSAVCITGLLLKCLVSF